VVIVVIAILAAITVVAYSGITSQATVASLQSDLTNAAKVLKMDQVMNSTYPATLAAANDGKGIPASPGTTYEYAFDNTASPPTFCIVATKGVTSYKITNNNQPVAGNCLDYGLSVHFDAGNALSYPGSGTSISDLSGHGITGTLLSGVGYNASDGGALVFDGVDDVVSYPTASIPNLSTFTASAWIYIAGDGSEGINGVMNGKAFRFFIYNSNNIIWTQIVGVTPYSDNSLTVVPRNQWVNVAFSYDGTNRNYYVNGVPVRQNPSTGTPTNPQDGEVGSIQGVWYAFNGRISDVSVYNRALSAGEFQQNFNLLRSRYGL